MSKSQESVWKSVSLQFNQCSSAHEKFVRKLSKWMDVQTRNSFSWAPARAKQITLILDLKFWVLIWCDVWSTKVSSWRWKWHMWWRLGPLPGIVIITRRHRGQLTSADEPHASQLMTVSSHIYTMLFESKHIARDLSQKNKDWQTKCMNEQTNKRTNDEETEIVTPWAPYGADNYKRASTISVCLLHLGLYIYITESLWT